MKLSIVVPVYYNEENLEPLYADLKAKVFTKIDYDYEIRIREAEYRKEGVDYKFRYEREKIDLNLNTIKDLINQKKDIEKEIDYLRIEKEVTILKVLTPEQREQLSRIRYYR